MPWRSQLSLAIAGYFRAELGLGEAARRLLRAADAGGIKASTVLITTTTNRQDIAYAERRARATPLASLICATAAETDRVMGECGASLGDTYRVGLWFWEVEEFASSQWDGFAHVDEVWVATEYIRAAIAAVSPVPVRRMPLPLTSESIVVRSTDSTRPFTFYCSFDFLSSLERKNPVAVIDAFRQAFRSQDDVRLLIRTINGHQRPDRLANLREFAAGARNIDVCDRFISQREVSSLMAGIDCYVSLHRAEGLGLNMAEAMSNAKPVIATGYSGNLSFMTPDTGLLVDFTMVPIGPWAYPYPPSGVWADPDVDHAAHLMRSVVADPVAAAGIGRRAQAHLETYHDAHSAGQQLRRRLEEIAPRCGRFARGRIRPRTSTPRSVPSV